MAKKQLPLEQKYKVLIIRENKEVTDKIIKENDGICPKVGKRHGCWCAAFTDVDEECKCPLEKFEKKIRTSDEVKAFLKDNSKLFEKETKKKETEIENEKDIEEEYE